MFLKLVGFVTCRRSQTGEELPGTMNIFALDLQFMFFLRAAEPKTICQPEVAVENCSRVTG